MGLDQYLIAKTKTRENKPEEHTGACGGLFDIIPTTVLDHIEIGYWRKAYDQGQLIESIVSHGKDEHGNILIMAEEIDKINKEARRILRTHKFNREDGNDETLDDPNFRSRYYTWMSKRKWKDTIKFFREAKKIMKEDPEAEIYYHEWY